MNISPELIANAEQYTHAAEKFISSLGIRSTQKGYLYLQDAVCIGLSFPESIFPTMSEIYEIIARKHGDTSGRVKRSIVYSIDTAYETDREKLMQFFYYKVEKPYVNEVITLGMELIRAGDLS